MNSLVLAVGRKQRVPQFERLLLAVHNNEQYTANSRNNSKQYISKSSLLLELHKYEQ